MARSFPAPESDPLKELGEGIVTPSLAPSQSIPPARLTVVESVYHLPIDDSPTDRVTRFTRALKSDEQPYVRRAKVKEDWQPLEVGWLKGCSCLIIANDTSLGAQTFPTPQAKTELEKKVIELAISNGVEFLHFARINVGESLRFTPSQLSSLFIRSLSGEARATVTLMPE